MHAFRPFLLIVAALALSLALPAQGAPRRFQPLQYGALAALAAGNLLLITRDAPASAGWQKGVLLDEPFRNALRLGSPSARAAAGDVSDVLMWLLIAYPYAADAGADTYLTQGDPDSAVQLSLIASQSFLLTGFLRQLTRALIPRERPYQAECAGNPQYDADCNQEASRESFFSGHAAYSFTGAGLICSAHETFKLHAGMTPCYVALGAATAVSLARVMADKHFGSDIVTGALIGLVSGYYLPKWLNYGLLENGSIVPSFTRDGGGLSLALNL